MPAPSVTFTLVNGTTIKASDHNTNFQDLVNGITDGTKDLSINSLVTTAGITAAVITPGTIAGSPRFSGNPTISGNLVVNGNATLGDAVTDVTTVTGELKGARMFLIFGASSMSVADRFLSNGLSSTTVEYVYKMNRAGSVVGYTYSCVTTAFTSNMSAIFRVRKNSVTLVSSNTLTWTANNQIQSDTGTVARGTSTFASGDSLSLMWDYQAGIATVDSCGLLVEIQ